MAGSDEQPSTRSHFGHGLLGIHWQSPHHWPTGRVDKCCFEPHSYSLDGYRRRSKLENVVGSPRKGIDKSRDTFSSSVDISPDVPKLCRQGEVRTWHLECQEQGTCEGRNSGGSAHGRDHDRPLRCWYALLARVSAGTRREQHCHHHAGRVQRHPQPQGLADTSFGSVSLWSACSNASYLATITYGGYCWRVGLGEYFLHSSPAWVGDSLVRQEVLLASSSPERKCDANPTRGLESSNARSSTATAHTITWINDTGVSAATMYYTGLDPVEINFKLHHLRCNLGIFLKYIVIDNERLRANVSQTNFAFGDSFARQVQGTGFAYGWRSASPGWHAEQVTLPGGRWFSVISGALKDAGIATGLHRQSRAAYWQGGHCLHRRLHFQGNGSSNAKGSDATGAIELSACKLNGDLQDEHRSLGSLAYRREGPRRPSCAVAETGCASWDQNYRRIMQHIPRICARVRRTHCLRRRTRHARRLCELRRCRAKRGSSCRDEAAPGDGLRPQMPNLGRSQGFPQRRGTSPLEDRVNYPRETGKTQDPHGGRLQRILGGQSLQTLAEDGVAHSPPCQLGSELPSNHAAYSPNMRQSSTNPLPPSKNSARQTAL